jgi:hypothetical protein
VKRGLGQLHGVRGPVAARAGLSFILGMKIPRIPYAVAQWRREHPGEQIPDGHVFIQPWPADPNASRRDQVIYYQHRHDRARRSLRGIDQQIARARDSIEAHLTIVFAALAVSRWIENQTGWSIRRFVRTARRCRTVQIQAGPHTITAADPVPDDLRQALAQIHGRKGTHSYEAARQAFAGGAPEFRWSGRVGAGLLGRFWAGRGAPMP